MHHPARLTHAKPKSGHPKPKSNPHEKNTLLLDPAQAAKAIPYGGQRRPPHLAPILSGGGRAKPCWDTVLWFPSRGHPSEGRAECLVQSWTSRVRRGQKHEMFYVLWGGSGPGASLIAKLLLKIFQQHRRVHVRKSSLPERCQRVPEQVEAPTDEIPK